jgi:hypothetical protein
MLYSGLATSLSALQPSSVHARLSCGARKMTTASKTFSSSSPSGGGGGANVVTWDEDFTFHVPKTAASLKVMFFDDKQVEVTLMTCCLLN